MCEAPSTCRASTWEMVPFSRSAAYSGLIAAPGTPKACVTPSRCRICTAAWMALMRGMGLLSPGPGSRAPRRLVGCREGWSGAAGQLLDELEQRRVVEGAVALGLEAGDELGDDRPERDDDPGLAGGGGHDAQVLVVQLDAEPGREVAAEHCRRLAVEDRVAGQAPREDPHRGLGVDPVGLQEDDGLRDQLDGAGDDELVGRLDRLAGAGRPHVHDGPADRLEDRPAVGEVLRTAADHDREGPVDRALLAAAHRGVEDADPALPARLGDPRRHVRADRAHVDVQGPRLGQAVEAVLADGDRLDVGGVGDHRDDDVGVPHRLREAAGATPAPLHAPLGTYSSPTQPSYPASASRPRYRSRSSCPVPGSCRPGASAICTCATREPYVATTRSRSSPLTARWYRSQRKPRLVTPVSSATRSTTPTASAAVSSGYRGAPLTGSTRTVPPIRLAARPASARFSTASASCSSGR